MYLQLMYLQLMYLLSHIYKNIPVSFYFITTWNQEVCLCSLCRLPRIMKLYSPPGRRKHGRPSKRLLDTWDRNGSTSGPTPWQIYDDDDDDDDDDEWMILWWGSVRMHQNKRQANGDVESRCGSKGKPRLKMDVGGY